MKLLMKATPFSMFILFSMVPTLSSPAFAQGGGKDDEEDEIETLSVFEVAGPSFGYMGATPGGAQDIRYFRMNVTGGDIPHPNTITAEGLFSEHDLPISIQPEGDALLQVGGSAMATSLLLVPEAEYLVQIGFASGLDPNTWKREPLSLVAVVDKSGSMSGKPLELVKTSLLQIVSQLGPEDQLGIVLYGDRSHVYLPTTVMDTVGKRAARREIKNIESRGSTNMEAGLQVGFALARQSAEEFEGLSRVMLFTDERPNVGKTDAGSFMAIARAGSKAGIGMTTIGVGVQFGAELATEISSVRGGNLFFFADANEMVDVFTEEFDTMVTELAYDMRVSLAPARGLRIAGVYGIPRNQLRWEGEAIELSIETVFLSRKRGGIFFALAEDEPDDLPRKEMRRGAIVARASLEFLPVGNAEPVEQTVAVELQPSAEAEIGLKRGEYLINEYTHLKKATAQHLIENDQEASYQTLKQLRSLHPHDDPALKPEIELVERLFGTIALLSGHGSEIGAVEGGSEDGQVLWGGWEILEAPDDRYSHLVFWPGGGLEAYSESDGTFFLNDFKEVKYEEGAIISEGDRIDYKFIESDTLVMEFPYGILKLKRSFIPEVERRGNDEEIEVDPFTGLPERP